MGHGGAEEEGRDMLSVLLNGLAFSGILFLLAVGLTLILGLMRIVNFSHGSLFLLGAYAGIQFSRTVDNWWLGMAFAGVVLAAVGWFLERFLIRRLYGKDELLQLILTFGIVLILEDLIRMIWGDVALSANNVPPILQGSITWGNVTFPVSSLFVIVVASTICVVLWLALHRTKLGKQIIAASLDMQMTEALGINVSLLYSCVFALGSALAGIAGMLVSLKLSFVPSLGTEFLIYAFAVVVIGGLGSYRGSIYGSLLVGVSYSFGVFLLPDLAMIFIFALLLLTLIIKPRGLFGTIEEIHSPAVLMDEKVNLEFSLFGGRVDSTKLGYLFGIGVLLFMVLLPSFSPDFWILMGTELLIYIILASSLNMLLRTGMLSLSHAAFFGAGAYTASLFMIHVNQSLPLVLVSSAVVSGLLAFIIGALSIRHVEIYFALLTLAFAQFVYTLSFKWRSLTGGDDGLIGIPFPSLDFFGLTGSLFDFTNPIQYFYLTLLVTVLCFLLVRIIFRSPFGQILLAIRENAERVSFLGINPRRYKLAAFVIVGTLAGIAGATFAPFQGVISPSVTYWTKSTDPLFMNILGGVNSAAGPGVGAAIYVLFKDWLSSAVANWRIWFGLLLVVTAIAFPNGVTAYARLAAAKICRSFSAPVTGESRMIREKEASN